MERTRSSLASAAQNQVRPGRTWLQFSLRGFLVVLTTGCLWLGWQVERAREQQQAVKAIEASGGEVTYDWSEFKQAGASPFAVDRGQPGGPAWLRRLIGEDFFQTVETVNFLNASSRLDLEIRRAIPSLQRLPSLKYVAVRMSVTQQTQKEMKVALPDCDLEFFSPAR